ncbi:MAG: efflux RND transporter periplasmic adaptor subunit [Bdellovibrionales bacterium]|jgi:membrane fusion protein (multidrug efflux system)|nr:efflux RND transporter periplasmic adaptor subunit [Bdellovibrionales bacterium]
MAIRNVVSAVAVLALLGGGYAVYEAGWLRTSPAQAQAPAQDGPPPAVPVSVATIHQAPVPIQLQLPGRVSPFKVAEIRPQVSGIITKRLFEEGSDVKQGQQLYQIDEAIYRAAYDRANADLLKAQANLKAVEARAARYAELVKLNAVSKQEYDDADAARAQGAADVAVARAALATAKIDLDYTRVLAPISGRIGKSQVTEGALVTANQATAMSTVQQLDPVYVDITQSSSELMRLRRQLSASGKPVEAPAVKLVIEGDNEPYTHEGALQFSDVTVDQTTGAVQLRALFPNPESVLLPGLFVRAVVTIEQGVKGMMVPQQSVYRRSDSSAYVWLVGADNKVSQQNVTLDRAVGDKWLLAGGLEDGARVVVEGVQKIRPGAQVMPQEAGAAPVQQPAVDAPAAEPAPQAETENKEP